MNKKWNPVKKLTGFVRKKFKKSKSAPVRPGETSVRNMRSATSDERTNPKLQPLPGVNSYFQNNSFDDVFPNAVPAADGMIHNGLVSWSPKHDKAIRGLGLALGNVDGNGLRDEKFFQMCSELKEGKTFYGNNANLDIHISVNPEEAIDFRIIAGNKSENYKSAAILNIDPSSQYKDKKGGFFPTHFEFALQIERLHASLNDPNYGKTMNRGNLEGKYYDGFIESSFQEGGHIYGLYQALSKAGQKQYFVPSDYKSGHSNRALSSLDYGEYYKKNSEPREQISEFPRSLSLHEQASASSQQTNIASASSSQTQQKYRGELSLLTHDGTTGRYMISSEGKDSDEFLAKDVFRVKVGSVIYEKSADVRRILKNVLEKQNENGKTGNYISYTVDRNDGKVKISINAPASIQRGSEKQVAQNVNTVAELTEGVNVQGHSY